MVERRYGRTMLGWLLGTVASGVLGYLVLAGAFSGWCDEDSVDCSWGLEALALIPVLLGALLIVGPFAVYTVLKAVEDPVAAKTAWLTVALVVPAILLGRLTFGVVLLLGPPLGARFLALRGVRTAQAGPAPQQPTP